MFSVLYYIRGWTVGQIPWLLMPWLLKSPGHQQPWYSPCRTNRSLSSMRKNFNYRKTSNIRRTLADNKIVDHSDVVGASPVGAAPTTSSFSTWHLASWDSAKTAARQYENLLSVGIWCILYQRLDGTYIIPTWKNVIKHTLTFPKKKFHTYRVNWFVQPILFICTFQLLNHL